jgi:ketosteroid isomerase-like protein
MNNVSGALTAAKREVQTIIDRETIAWDTCNAEALVDLFHPDAVWPWPPDPSAHDPEHWVMPLGRFDRERWKRSWEELFDRHALVHNRRKTVRIEVSEQLDGAFAVVDVDTLWRNNESGLTSHWDGRACKVYTKVSGRWRLIYQTGLLRYPA